MDETRRTNLLYNRKLAAAVLAVAVVLSVFLGGGRGLKNARADVYGIYANGVDGDGIGIAKDLSARFAAAEKLWNLTVKHGLSVPELQEAIANYRAAGTMTQTAAANGALDTAAYAAYNLLQADTVPEADRRSAGSLYNEINSRGNMIRNDGYNAAALEFNEKTLSGFPAGLLAGLWGIEELELFR